MFGGKILLGSSSIISCVARQPPPATGGGCRQSANIGSRRCGGEKKSKPRWIVPEEKEAAPASRMPFWLKPFLLKRHIVDTCVEGQGFCVFCFLVKTDFIHGPQRMVSSRHSFGVVQCCAWTASTISSMATTAAVGAPVELSCSEVQSHRGQGGFSVEAQVAARQRSGNPDEVQAAARSRVERLERALSILGEGDSAEIRGLQAALKEARCVRLRTVLWQFKSRNAKHSFNVLRRGWSVCRRNRSKNNSSWTQLWRVWQDFERRWPGRQHQVPQLVVPRRTPHTAREDPRVGRRVGSIEGSRGRDGDRARGGSEETFTVPVCAFPRFGWGDVSLQERGVLQDQRVGQHQGALMETLISRGSTLAQSNRFSPLT